MKNVWKGLAVGAMVGAAVGVILDVLEGTGRRAVEVSARAKAGASHLADIVEEKFEDLPGRVRDLVE